MSKLPGLSHLLLSGASFPGIGSFLTCIHCAAKSPGVISENLRLCSYSLSLILYSLTFQNSAILLISENSEISLLNLMRPPGSVWVFPPYAVAWTIFPGREIGHSQNCICLLLFLGVTILHFLVSRV